MRPNLLSSPIINEVLARHRAGHKSGAIRTKEEFSDFQLHIIFETPRWKKGELVKSGSVTVIHNGVVLHHRQEILGAVAHKNVPKYTPHDPHGPITLQDHGNPMRFRNIWIRPIGS